GLTAAARSAFTLYPSSASLMAGSKRDFHGSFPCALCSASQPRSSPGTPADSPPYSCEVAFARYIVSFPAAGIVSRKSIWARSCLIDKGVHEGDTPFRSPARPSFGSGFWATAFQNIGRVDSTVERTHIMKPPPPIPEWYAAIVPTHRDVAIIWSEQFPNQPLTRTRRNTMTTHGVSGSAALLEHAETDVRALGNLGHDGAVLALGLVVGHRVGRSEQIQHGQQHSTVEHHRGIPEAGGVGACPWGITCRAWESL
ncbi:unnamed protein product, partial [Mycena citricolor]